MSRELGSRPGVQVGQLEQVRSKQGIGRGNGWQSKV